MPKKISKHGAITELGEAPYRNRDLKSMLSANKMYMAQLNDDEVLILTEDYNNEEADVNETATTAYSNASITFESREVFSQKLADIGVNAELIEPWDVSNPTLIHGDALELSIDDIQEPLEDM